MIIISLECLIDDFRGCFTGESTSPEHAALRLGIGCHDCWDWRGYQGMQLIELEWWWWEVIQLMIDVWSCFKVFNWKGEEKSWISAVLLFPPFFCSISESQSKDMRHNGNIYQGTGALSTQLPLNGPGLSLELTDKGEKFVGDKDSQWELGSSVNVKAQGWVCS